MTSSQSALTLTEAQFVRSLAAGNTQKQAAIDAGYAEGGAKSIGCQLAKNPRIKQVLESIRDNALQIAEIDRSWVLKRLGRSIDIALTSDPPQCMAANKAIELIGRELGMFKEMPADVKNEFNLTKIERIIVDATNSNRTSV